MMDVDGGPPRSVELQRELEERIDLVRDAIEPAHVVAVAIVAVLVYAIATGDASSATTSTGEWLAGVSLVDVAKFAAGVIGVGIAFGVNVAIHEECHRLAFERFDVSSRVEIEWPEVGKRDLYFFPAGGVCSAVSIRDYARMSWREDAVVALAPAVWGALLVAGVFAYHAFVSPLPSVDGIALLVFLFSGPSIPDYLSVLRTPRDRWEFLVGLEESVDRHAAAEGLEV